MKLETLVTNTVLLYNDRKSIHLIGSPGTGKSTIVEHDMIDVLSENFKEQFGCVTFTLTTIDAPDIRGFCIPTKDENKKAIAVFTQSAIMTAVLKTGCKRGILFLDERGQADTLVQKGIAPTVHEGRLGDDYLPEGWWVVSASNRIKDRSGVNKPLAHLTNRERVIDIEADIDGVAKFFERKEYHPLTIAFMKARPGVVITNEVPSKEGPYCTPRSLESSAKLLTNHPLTTEHTIANGADIQELIEGDVGQGTALEMYSFFKVANKLPTKDEIIADPKTAKVPAIKDLDAQYAAMQLCIHHSDKDNVDAFFIYIRRLKKEMQTSAAKALLEKGGGALLNSVELSKFISENRALIVGSMA